MKAFFARALVFVFPCVAMAQIAVLQIKVVEGDGAVHPAGARIPHPLTVEVADENGHPVPGAAVSFQLPADGPGGLFSNGLRTDLVMTDAGGRAALHGIQLNRTGGSFRVRITAVKEQARAGVVAMQYIGGPPAKTEPAAAGAVTRTTASKPATVSSAAPAKSGEITPTNSRMAPASHKKWIVIAAIAAAGGAAFLGVSRSSSQSTGIDNASKVSIGTPVITIGHP